jgi:hypothetical protein
VPLTWVVGVPDGQGMILAVSLRLLYLVFLRLLKLLLWHRQLGEPA